MSQNLLDIHTHRNLFAPFWTLENLTHANHNFSFLLINRQKLHCFTGSSFTTLYHICRKRRKFGRDQTIHLNLGIHNSYRIDWKNFLVQLIIGRPLRIRHSSTTMLRSFSHWTWSEVCAPCAHPIKRGREANNVFRFYTLFVSLTTNYTYKIGPKVRSAYEETRFILTKIDRRLKLNKTKRLVQEVTNGEDSSNASIQT